MSTLRNRVTLIGHLGMDPELVTFDNGGQKARFTLATNEKYTNKGGDKVEETQWHNVVAFGKTADLITKYTKKGREVALEGKLTTRDYTDDKGVKRYITEVIVNEIVLLSSKN
jgi:single-strand DNA-binding protein